MKQVWLFLVSTSFLAFTHPGFAQQVTQPANWRVEWRNSTVAFGTVEKKFGVDYFYARGTGVMIKTGDHSAFLVTAKHMFCKPEDRWYPRNLNVRFAWEDQKSIYSFLGITLPLRDDKGVPLWTATDDDSDVAALPVPSNLNDLLPADDRKDSVPLISAANFDSDIFEGEQVFILGYPAIAGNDNLNRAVWREGIVAWVNASDAGSKPFFVNANVYPGNSGGPVIKFPFGLMKSGQINLAGGQPALLGIVSQGWEQDIKTTVAGKLEHTQIAGIGAIGVIEPVSRILTLLTNIQRGTTKPPVCDVQ